MSALAIPLGLTLFGLLAMSGCATPSRQKEKNLQTHWATKKYEVSFTSGPEATGGRKTFSFYRIRSLSSPPGEEIIVPSAQTTNGLQSAANSNPKNYIRLIEDPENAVLLIQEDIINDCCPCTNYALIEPNPDGGLPQYRFLQFRARPTGTRQGAFGQEFPSISAVSDSTIEYKYGNGPVEQSDIKSLPSKEEPTPPG